MHKILVIRLYFPLNALHVSGCISPSSGAKFLSFTSYLVCANTSGCCKVITKYDVKLTNFAPEDGLMQSETCRAFNGK